MYAIDGSSAEVLADLARDEVLMAEAYEAALRDAGLPVWVLEAGSSLHRGRADDVHGLLDHCPLELRRYRDPLGALVPPVVALSGCIGALPEAMLLLRLERRLLAAYFRGGDALAAPACHLAERMVPAQEDTVAEAAHLLGWVQAGGMLHPVVGGLCRLEET